MARTVTGTIRNQTDQAIAAAIFQAFERSGSRREDLLAKGSTDAVGNHKITYDLDRRRQSQVRKVNLVVRVFNAVGTELGSPTGWGLGKEFDYKRRLS